jgi:hypothetical protein
MFLNGRYSKVHIGKQLHFRFPIQNHLKQGDPLSPLLFQLRFKIRQKKVQENELGLKLNGTHQLLAYTDDLNLLRDNIATLNKSKETLVNGS